VSPKKSKVIFWQRKHKQDIISEYGSQLQEESKNQNWKGQTPPSRKDKKDKRVKLII
jgi:hypothetical protein